MSNSRRAQRGRAPLRVTGILFALAANLLLTTGADIIVRRLHAGFDFEIVATLIAPLLAGVLSALYIRQRAAMHAFIGGMISIPVLAVYVFSGSWQFAVFAGAFCTLGGTMTEILLRKRAPSA